MNVARLRAILGVWAPMAIGLLIIATSINFYLTARLPPDLRFREDLESWRLVCSAGAFFVGGVMILSTLGRYKKAKVARRATPGPSGSVTSPDDATRRPPQ